VGNNKDPDQKRPGEREPGTFHYNPGNMSGKTIGAEKDESKSDGTHSRDEDSRSKRKA
jgi:hypothetical protein